MKKLKNKQPATKRPTTKRKKSLKHKKPTTFITRFLAMSKQKQIKLLKLLKLI